MRQAAPTLHHPPAIRSRIVAPAYAQIPSGGQSLLSAATTAPANHKPRIPSRTRPVHLRIRHLSLRSALTASNTLPRLRRYRRSLVTTLPIPVGRLGSDFDVKTCRGRLPCESCPACAHESAHPYFNRGFGNSYPIVGEDQSIEARAKECDAGEAVTDVGDLTSLHLESLVDERAGLGLSRVPKPQGQFKLPFARVATKGGEKLSSLDRRREHVYVETMRDTKQANDIPPVSHDVLAQESGLCHGRAHSVTLPPPHAQRKQISPTHAR